MYIYHVLRHDNWLESIQASLLLFNAIIICMTTSKIAICIQRTICIMSFDIFSCALLFINSSSKLTFRTDSNHYYLSLKDVDHDDALWGIFIYKTQVI